MAYHGGYVDVATRPQEVAERTKTMANLVEEAALLSQDRVYLFFRHQGHFFNPLVPREWELLKQEPAVEDPAVRRVVREILLPRAGELGDRIYFPVPMAQGLEKGQGLSTVLDKFHYELIHVDAGQVWRWKGEAVAPKVKRLFVEHLSYEPALDLYFVEYQVSPTWWDKCYLDAVVTPMVGTRVMADDDGSLAVVLNNGKKDVLDPHSFHLDDRERLFAASAAHGRILFSESARFALLQGVSDDGQSIQVGEKSWPLRWPQE